jgi:hypothetical protein
MRALMRVRFAVLAIAWVEYDIWQPEADKEECMAWAWEDMRLAFSGYGDSFMTGAVVHFWTALGRDRWKEAVRVINAAAMEAEETTPKTVPRNYFSSYRYKTVRTPDDGFDLPALVPTRGKRVRAWAVANNLPPDEVEDQMALLEEYERMGMINLKENGSFLTMQGTRLKGEEPEAQEEPPGLRLVR